jgi:hypothetical protein
MAKLNLVVSVADVLERELEPTIKDWLRRVNLISELTCIPLNDADRTGHLRKLYLDVISRLRNAKRAERPASVAAAAHGQIRHSQGYSVVMLIEESRVFQVATFAVLHLHQSQLDQKKVLADVMVIADEVDSQLKESVCSLTASETNRGRSPAHTARSISWVPVE